MARRKKSAEARAAQQRKPCVCPDCAEKLGLDDDDDGESAIDITSMSLGYVDSLLSLAQRLQDYRIKAKANDDLDLNVAIGKVEKQIVGMIDYVSHFIMVPEYSEDDDEDDEDGVSAN